MFRHRFLSGALIAIVLSSTAPLLADDEASAGEKLARAVELFNQGDYTAARDLLQAIAPDDLKTEDEQLQHEHLLRKSAEGIAGVEEARRSFDQGSAALAQDNRAEAKRQFAEVTKNPYAPAGLRTKAQSHLNALENSQPRGAGSSAPIVADAKPPAGGSLVDQLTREHELLWQRAVAEYKALEKRIQASVQNNNYPEAALLLDAAKDVIETNRRYASPPSRYEDLRQQATDLELYVGDRKREYDERLILDATIEIGIRKADQAKQIQDTKNRRIEELMNRSSELSKEQRIAQAIQVLDEVLGIDPNHEAAKWKRETYEDLLMNRRDVQAVTDHGTQVQKVLVDNDEAGIPWSDNIRYPKNWLEIIAKRPTAEEEGDTPENREVRNKLRRVAPEIKFDALPFEEVVEQLRALTGLNINVNWNALEFSAIDRDHEVTLTLTSGVKWEKVLKLILDDVGGGEVDLAYEIDSGVVSVSTKEDLSRRTLVQVYNIKDLLITVPTFRGRRINLQNIGQTGQIGGLGGGRFVGPFGGGFGGGGQQGGGFFDDGGQQDEEEEDILDPLEPIIDLIQETIDPESWREAGGNVGSISALQQQLIVTQTSTAHTQLRDLLRQLRQAKALQVAVEARYITISRNWLEQIGVDLDVILNNGNAGFDRTTIINPATGNPILVPRQFTRLGFTPGAPSGVGITTPTQPFGHPFGQPGLTPAPGDIAPHSSGWSPIPIVNNTLDLAAPSDTNIDGSLGSLVNSTPAFQMFGSFLDNIQVDFLLRATQVDKRASDLDAPRLVLFNGQRATFESFIEQDYIAALQPVIGDNAGAFLPVVDTALTGRSLDVQATVSADRRYVTMTVRTFTQVTGDFRTVFFGGSTTVGSGFLELATRTTQQIRTTVSVPDGGTLLIGGLKLSGERDVDAGVPILSRIPVLKRAFSNTSNVKDDQVLLILIKPTIIIQEEAEADAFPTLSGAPTAGI